MDFVTRIPSPLGDITLACDGEALTGLWFAGQAHELYGLDPRHEERPHPLFYQAEAWLRLYFAGQEPDFTPPLAPRGSAFQQAVWRELLTIPYGQTLTYGELARRLGCPSARAVGQAVGRNPISLLIPCHRVLGAGGRLTGYAGGLRRKAALLRLEGILPPAKEQEAAP